LIVDTLTQSNKESNLNRSSAVPIADDARPPNYTDTVVISVLSKVCKTLSVCIILDLGAVYISSASPVNRAESYQAKYGGGKLFTYLLIL
jgi:hypothetical protein